MMIIIQVFEMICLKSINFYDILNNAFEFTLISNRHIKS